MRRKAQLEDPGIQTVQQAEADFHQVDLFQQHGVRVVVLFRLFHLGGLQTAQGKVLGLEGELEGQLFLLQPDEGTGDFFPRAKAETGLAKRGERPGNGRRFFGVPFAALS